MYVAHRHMQVKLVCMDYNNRTLACHHLLGIDTTKPLLRVEHFWPPLDRLKRVVGPGRDWGWVGCLGGGVGGMFRAVLAAVRKQK